ncbi:GGDEF domain-containing protein [Caulobacter sp. S45]|jgi:diguanylate cyclase (GGDEF)-like protein|uniref:GGDEF domain-containing protein n=1 Tax=Caulobacter sp. S45 TaxID=1641861 RepID=UPI0020B177DE|nr:GGDEF domain-containing protein [Caulobacter sp. S45]
MSKALGQTRIDTLAGLGLSEAELTPAVREALARLLAEQAACGAEIAHLTTRLAEAERLADRDPLTPVLNRRAFVRELQRSAAFCNRYDAPASLVYFDLDGFKGVNDRFGHAAGDAALAVTAQILVDNVRESDVVGRLGGDEFAVILAQADGPAAMAKAQSLTEIIGAAPVVFEGELIPLKASAGVRAYEPGLEPTRWLAEADAAMFLRKGLR